MTETHQAETFNVALKLALVERRWTQRAFSAAIGVDQWEFSRIVNGKIPAPHIRKAIARKLRRRQADLFPVSA